MEYLEGRLQAIETRLSAVEQQLGVESETLIAQGIPAEVPQKPNKQPSVVDQLPPLSSFTLWLKKNWIAVSGILLVLLSCSWFVSYAFECGWITGTMRVYLSFVIGIIIGGYGFTCIKNESHAQLFILLGETISILSIYAGFHFYSMFSAHFAFIMMLSIITAIAVYSIRKGNETLGVASILFALFVPFGLYGYDANPRGLLSYVSILDCIALSMFLTRNWSKALHVAFFATCLSFNAFIPQVGSLSVLFFTVIFALIFFIPSIVIASGNSERTLTFRGAIMLLTSMGVINWSVTHFTTSPWPAICSCSLAFVVLYFARSLLINWERLQGEQVLQGNTLFSQYGLGTLFCFLACYSVDQATYCVVPEPGLVIIFLIEIAVGVSVSLMFLKAPVAGFAITLWFLSPITSIFEQGLSLFYLPFTSLHFWNLCVAILTISYSMWVLYAATRSVINWWQNLIIGWLGAMSALFTMELIASISHNLFANANTARGVALVIYVLAAELFIYVGNVKQWKIVRYCGIGIIALVLARLFFDEIWNMPIVLRTVICAIVGVLLIGTAYLDKKCKNPYIGKIFYDAKL